MDLPIDSMVIFHSYVTVYQRVYYSNLPNILGIKKNPVIPISQPVFHGMTFRDFDHCSSQVIFSLNDLTFSFDLISSDPGILEELS